MAWKRYVHSCVTLIGIFMRYTVTQLHHVAPVLGSHNAFWKLHKLVVNSWWHLVGGGWTCRPPQNGSGKVWVWMQGSLEASLSEFWGVTFVSAHASGRTCQTALHGRGQRCSSCSLCVGLTRVKPSRSSRLQSRCNDKKLTFCASLRNCSHWSAYRPPGPSNRRW